MGQSNPGLPRRVSYLILYQLRISRCYSPAGWAIVTTEFHVFCDASEKAYSSVAYLWEVDAQDESHLAFVMACSRVAPKCQLTMPHLELRAAHSGAQLANILQEELTFPLNCTILWSDSTMVLTWIQSECWCYKIFVANQITEILEFTSGDMFLLP